MAHAHSLAEKEPLKIQAQEQHKSSTSTSRSRPDQARTSIGLRVVYFCFFPHRIASHHIPAQLSCASKQAKYWPWWMRLWMRRRMCKCKCNCSSSVELSSLEFRWRREIERLRRPYSVNPSLHRPRLARPQGPLQAGPSRALTDGPDADAAPSHDVLQLPGRPDRPGLPLLAGWNWLDTPPRRPPPACRRPSLH